jgi:hypothetical protein
MLLEAFIKVTLDEMFSNISRTREMQSFSALLCTPQKNSEMACVL